MESIPETSIIRLPSGALYDIRKIHNMDKPGSIEQGVNILEAWILKQNHIIKKDFSREYLERTLVRCKGSVERSKKQIDRLCTMKTLMPKYFSKTNVKMELQCILKLGVMVVPLPVATDDYYRIIMIHITNKDFTNESLLPLFQYIIVLAEYLIANDYNNGYKIIYDFRQMNLFDLISKLNTVELQQFLSILDDGYGARLQSIYMLTESKTIELVINIVKQFVSEKICNRILVQRSLEDLHKAVPRELLPVDCGGTQKSVKKLHAAWIEELSSEKHVMYVKIMFKAYMDETKRQSGKFNEEYMGMPGSFRCLSVD